MEDKKVVVLLDSEDVATVLAALRYWQRTIDDPKGSSPEHFEDVEPLDDGAIDDLCERINCSPDDETPVIVVEGGVVQGVFLPIPGSFLGKPHPCTPVPYSLIDYDNLKEMSDSAVVYMWNSFSPALQNYFINHCGEEFNKYFATPLDEACTCHERSWYGPEHDTACPVEGSR